MLHNETLTILDAIHPESRSTAVSTAYVPMADFARILAIVQVGLIAATGTFNAKLEQAQDASGTGVKDITGKAITQLADTADNKQAIINCDAADLDVNGGFTHVRLTLTPAVAASLLAGLLLGGDQRYSPKAQAASVVQVVA